MDSGERWHLGYRPELDGLRAIAVLLVLVTHAGIEPLRAAGTIGVTMFFTLSGFLITTLLLVEREETGTVSLSAFYRRRALRLLPAMVAMLAVVGGILAVGLYGPRWLVRETVPVIFYFGNWVRAEGDYLGAWSHTWSLAVEEQFYLVWPLLLIFLVRLGRRGVLAAVLVGSVYAVAARLVLWDGGAGLERVYYGSDTHADALLLGAGLAAVTHGRGVGRARPKLAVALVAAMAAWSVSGGAFATLVVGATVVPVLMIAAIWAAVTGSGVSLLRWGPLVAIGRRSYGLYLWHYPIYVVLTPFVPGPPIVAVVVLGLLSWVVTLASWRWVEVPFLRLKRRPESEPAATPSVAGLHEAAVSVGSRP